MGGGLRVDEAEMRVLFPFLSRPHRSIPTILSFQKIKTGTSWLSNHRYLWIAPGLTDTGQLVPGIFRAKYL